LVRRARRSLPREALLIFLGLPLHAVSTLSFFFLPPCALFRCDCTSPPRCRANVSTIHVFFRSYKMLSWSSTPQYHLSPTLSSLQAASSGDKRALVFQFYTFLSFIDLHSPPGFRAVPPSRVLTLSRAAPRVSESGTLYHETRSSVSPGGKFEGTVTRAAFAVGELVLGRPPPEHPLRPSLD